MLDFQPNSEAFKGKTILVTGAGDGIGKEAAKQYAQYGANVILLGRTVKKLEATYDECVKNSHAEMAIVPLDMEGATVKHYQDMATTIESQFGKLDGLLHNASLLGQLQPFGQISPEEYQQVMQVNVNATFYMTQAMLPVLKKAPHASVIFTTSTVGNKGRAYWGTYAISKFATEGMMQCLADEYSNTHLRFNCINPGGTRTNMRAKAFPAENPDNLKTPAQIMPAYLYLMDDASINTTGETLICQPK
ncbi:YciK family oxidoreductase [Planctobacterium marinum]|uniref:YciK family oxidoreductase n=1 Tax=Planctobacterium marinum TaxID=1631968 RepID=UPI001E60FF71|nr:YciK family oxidoreductase [Planctobacterium marinum]MCC2604187.1 YciK family oxidoreductase [Planctobacterium marinum]